MERTIYLLRDPRDDSPRYVGITLNLEKRIWEHFNNSHLNRERNRRVNWIKSLKKIGLLPLVEVLEVVHDDSWQDYERAWILGFKGCGAHLVNATDGGDGCENPSLETRAKISASLIGNKRSLGKNLGNKHTLGKKASKETRAKMSATRLGRKFSEEHRANMSAARKGISFSLAHINNICIAQRARRIREGK